MVLPASPHDPSCKLGQRTRIVRRSREDRPDIASLGREKRENHAREVIRQSEVLRGRVRNAERAIGVVQGTRGGGLVEGGREDDCVRKLYVVYSKLKGWKGSRLGETGGMMEPEVMGVKVVCVVDVVLGIAYQSIHIERRIQIPHRNRNRKLNLARLHVSPGKVTP